MSSGRFRLPRVHLSEGTAGSISKLFFQPLLRHKHPHYATKDFLEGLFDSEVQFDIRIALYTFTYGGQLEDVAIGPPHPHQPITARLGDVFTARFNPALSFVHVEVSPLRHQHSTVYRCTPEQWELIKKHTKNKEEFNMRKGQGHDTITRNMNKLQKLGFDPTTTAELTYISAGRIGDKET